MRVAIKSLCVLLFSLMFAVGCGQKGPLFLPGDPSAIKTDVPAQSRMEQPEVPPDDKPDEEDEDKQDP